MVHAAFDTDFEGTISIGYGVVADIANSAERGSYVGALACGLVLQSYLCLTVEFNYDRPNLAPSLGPILGGVLVQETSWRWIFGFLAITSFVCLLCMILALPETARSISGDGSFPGRSWHRVPSQLLLKNGQTRPRNPSLPSQLTPKIPNPLKSLRLLLYPDTLPIILINSLTYTTYCCLQVSLSTLFIDLYSYTALQAGLVYLPFGIGCLISSFLSTAAQVGIEVDLVQKTDLMSFPIEKARFRSMWWIVVVGAVAMGGYGWVLEKRVHPSVPLILQFILGATLPRASVQRKIQLLLLSGYLPYSVLGSTPHMDIPKLNMYIPPKYICISCHFIYTQSRFIVNFSLSLYLDLPCLLATVYLPSPSPLRSPFS